jgi:formyltetrahydrofolate-dependent phosphoribosylglycinamide formyltransferase
MQNKINLIVLISGNGTNLQFLIDRIKSRDLNANIKLVISNKKNAYGLERAINNGIETLYLPFKRKVMIREKYGDILGNIISKYDYHLIVCAGWMVILPENFIRQHPNIINLHPALPGKFPGATAKEDAYNAFLRGEITHTGCMSHWVIPELDSGKVISSVSFKIGENMSLLDVKKIIEYKEKFCLLKSIKKIQYQIFNTMNNVESLFNFNSEPYVGKVRDVYTVSQSSSNCSQDDRLVIVQTDRCSAFDHHICNIEGKGSILTETAAWWFKKMGHVMPNHYLHHTGNMMIVKKCLPIKLEIIVRNYITGSLWNHYSKGNREYCGVELPDGLQKIPNFLI